MPKPEGHPIVLALVPIQRGVAYAAFEKPTAPVDWGAKQARSDIERHAKASVKELIELHEPEVLVLLEHRGTTASSSRASRLVEATTKIATDVGIAVVQYSRDDIRTVFAQFGGVTKYYIAKTISEWLPGHSSLEPRRRKPWMSDPYSMAIFDAIALGITYYFFYD